MAKVELKSLQKSFVSKGRRVEAVRDLNLAIEDGELMVLLGPSGCGKTTTLRMIVGLEAPTAGEILIGGKLVNRLSPQERNVAMAFETYALYSHLTVKENLMFPLRAAKTAPSEREARLAKVASMLEIEGILNEKPSSLSGGQQQRVSLGRALIRQPTVFLLDEPLSHLDSSLRIATRNHIKRLHGELKATMIHVTHDQLEAIALADRVAVMNFAVLQQVGPPEELLAFPANLFVANFLGEPPMNLLEARLSSEGGQLFAVAGKSLKLPVPGGLNIDEKEAAEGLVAGLRPQDLKLCQESEAAFSARVEIAEFLGEYVQLSLKADELSLTMVADPARCPAPGEAVWLRFDNNRLHFFGQGSGERLKTA
ncbi:MAG: ABC transporter ATP-binding protein [Deltaproteobacteria bacterium]|jgi:multiple sugar transport system ATP-binding protein|nr:ABC transporter ATP-binding protein [Deltaproteobacteria bacterium]